MPEPAITSHAADEPDRERPFFAAVALATVLGMLGLAWSEVPYAVAGAILGLLAGWTAALGPFKPSRTAVALGIVGVIVGAYAALFAGSGTDWRPGVVATAIGAIAGAISPNVLVFLAVLAPSVVMWPLGVTILPGYVVGALVAIAARQAPQRARAA